MSYKFFFFNIFLFIYSNVLTQDNSSVILFSELLNTIESEYPVHFSYDPELIQKYQYAPTDNSSINLERLLNEVFAEMGIHYLILDEKYILIRKNRNEIQYEHKSLSGTVYDEKTRKRLPFASIYLKHAQTGAISNDQGLFNLQLKEEVATDTLVISYIGYKSQQYPISALKNALVIYLKEQDQTIDGVNIVITDKDIGFREQLSLSDVKFMNTNQSTYFGGDPMKALQFLPGITKDGTTSDLRIRGGEGQNTLILIDEIPILKVDHYYNIFSNINPQHISTTELYKNNIPVEYGGKTAGLVKFESKKHHPDLIDIESNMLFSSVGIHRNIGEDVSINLSGRVSYVDFFNNATSEFIRDNLEVATDIQTIEKLNESFAPDFRFYDINFGINKQFGDEQSLSFNIFNSNDHFQFSRTRIREIKLGMKEFLIEDTFSNTERWSNLGASFIHKKKLGFKWDIKNIAYFSNYTNQLNLNKTLFQATNNENFNEIYDANLDNELETYGFKSVINGILNPNEQLSVGVELKSVKAKLIANENEERFIESTQTDLDFSIFSEFTRYFNQSSQLKLGLRSTYLRLANSYYMLPNISFKHNISNTFQFKSAYSMDIQGVAELGFENRIGQQLSYFVVAEESLYPASRADKLMTGFSFEKERFGLDVEAYYKWQNDILQLISLEPSGNGLNNISPTNLYEFFVGDGKIRGIDVLMNYAGSNWNTAVSYTLSKSSQTFNNIYRGLEYLSPNDRRHVFQWINEFPVRDFNFTCSYIFQSGNPYIDFSQLIIKRDKIDPSEVQVNLPNYHRIDLGVNYTKKLPFTELSFGVEVLNIFDHKNVKFNHQASNVKRQDQTIGIIIGNESTMLERSLNISLKARLF